MKILQPEIYLPFINTATLSKKVKIAHFQIVNYNKYLAKCIFEIQSNWKTALITGKENMKKFQTRESSVSTIEEATLKIKELTKEIAQDKVITEDEIYSLLSWLNTNKKFTDAWPFNLLYKFLFHAFEDGTISDSEKASLFNLIDEIQTLNTPSDDYVI
ncbi:MAG: hypothetical protein HQM10_24340 [Candidatus Riflebacteria bacterium]|nr:hypothetical protein [Candidatus Riflebacteria bacterium]